VLCYEIFKKWPLLSLFPSSIWKKLLLFSLSNNFGTLNSCSGLFPFRHITLSYYVWLFNNKHCPSEIKNLLIKSSQSPNKCNKIINIIYFYYCIRFNSVPTMILVKLHTLVCFAENQLYQARFVFHILP
jgi:hypothetical protein